MPVDAMRSSDGGTAPRAQPTGPAQATAEARAGAARLGIVDDDGVVEPIMEMRRKRRRSDTR
jgi:hypothetical protein